MATCVVGQKKGGQQIMANKEFEKYCNKHPKTAKEMAEFMKYAEEIGLLSSSPTGSDVATLCRAYQEGRRRYLRQLSETNIAKKECERELRDQGVDDDSLIDTTCSPIEEPSLKFDKKSESSYSSPSSSSSVEEQKQRKRPSIVERTRSSLDKARKKVVEKIEKRREKKEEEASCVRRVMVTGKSRRDAERFCKK